MARRTMSIDQRRVPISVTLPGPILERAMRGSNINRSERIAGLVARGLEAEGRLGRVDPAAIAATARSALGAVQEALSAHEDVETRVDDLLKQTRAGDARSAAELARARRAFPKALKIVSADCAQMLREAFESSLKVAIAHCAERIQEAFDTSLEALETNSTKEAARDALNTRSLPPMLVIADVIRAGLAKIDQAEQALVAPTPAATIEEAETETEQVIYQNEDPFEKFPGARTLQTSVGPDGRIIYTPPRDWKPPEPDLRRPVLPNDGKL